MAQSLTILIILVLFAIICFVIYLSKTVYISDKDYDILYTIKCPKCGDTYEIEDKYLAGDGLTPVQCFKCGYSYKQNNHIVHIVFKAKGEDNEDNN